MITNTNRILRSSDPLDVPAGAQKEPTFPVLREGIRTMLVKGIEEKVFPAKEGKEESTGVQITLALMEEDQDTDGQKLYPGFPVKSLIFTTPNAQNSLEKIAQVCAMPVKAILGKDTKVSLRQCINDPSLIVNKPVKVDVRVRPAKSGSDFGDSNVVKAWLIPE